jgi:hypothetical protein
MSLAVKKTLSCIYKRLPQKCRSQGVIDVDEAEDLVDGSGDVLRRESRISGDLSQYRRNIINQSAHEHNTRHVEKCRT